MLECEVYNHQEAVTISDEQLDLFTTLANKALPLVLEHPAHNGGVCNSLEIIEVSIVDDETIAQVHVDFMDIPGATDVITFSHGEIVVSSQTAEKLGSEYGHSTERELFLYMIHGLLHLCGHEDEDPSERAVMEEIQFTILDQLFPKV